jgi:hypothetical protein
LLIPPTARAILARLFSGAVVAGAVVANAAGCGNDDDRAPVWNYISPAIIQPNCAGSSCHSRLAAVSGLNLSTVADGYISLRQLNLPVRDKTDLSPRELVVPYDPDQSRLMYLLRGEGVPRRMPPDRPLPPAHITLIEQWILHGAQND